MRQYMVEILRISSFLMVFFYRRFLPLDVFIYAFGAENDASSANLPIPLLKPKRLSQILHLRQSHLFKSDQLSELSELSSSVLSDVFSALSESDFSSVSRSKGPDAPLISTVS